jgi:hypothetical protein
MSWVDPNTITTAPQIIAIDDLTDGSDGLGTSNVFLGEFSGVANVAGGNNNVGLGRYSLNALTSGDNNVATGHQSLYRNTSGTGNVASGYRSIYTNTTGSYNTAFGYRPLYLNTTGAYNIAFGVNSLYSNTNGSGNLSSGYNSMYYATTGNSYNVATGYQSMQGTGAYTTSSYNVANGYRSLYSISGGDNNTSVGTYSGDNITTGSRNIMIGYNSEAPSATANYQLNIGNIIYGTTINGSGSTISSGNIGIGTKTPSEKLDVNGQIRMRTGSTNGYIIQGDASGTMSWVDPSTLSNANNVSFYVYNSGNDVQSAGWMSGPVDFNIEEHDDGNNFSLDKFQAPSAGVYHFSAQINLQNVAAGTRYRIDIYVNGVTLVALNTGYTTTTNLNYESYGGSATVKLNASDLVEIRVYCQNAYTIGGAGTRYTSFSGHKLY